MTYHNCRIECKRKGKDRKGNQRYQCRQCSKTFQEPREKALDGIYLPMDKAEQVLKLLVEGCSVSTIERFTGVHHGTILKLLVLAGERCERLLSEKIQAVPVADVQLDELWGFCFCKEKNNRTEDPKRGDSWCFVAIERTNKLILAWHLGRRTAAHTLEFTEKLRLATSGRLQCTADGFGPYPDAIEYRSTASAILQPRADATAAGFNSEGNPALAG